jgi:hypothetical protein
MKKYFKIMLFACLILCSVYAVTGFIIKASYAASGMAGTAFVFAGLLITCGCCFVIRESYKDMKKGNCSPCRSNSLNKLQNVLKPKSL